MSEQLTQNAAAAAVPSENGKDEITFKILEHLGVLRASAAGWTRELNYVSWCDRPPKYDVREWTPDHKKSTRGMTFTDYEMKKICEWVTARNTQLAGGGSPAESAGQQGSGDIE